MIKRSPETEWLLQEIEQFLSETGMSPTTLGTYAIKNPYIVERLRNGCDILTSTAQRLREFMRNWKLNGDA